VRVRCDQNSAFFAANASRCRSASALSFVGVSKLHPQCVFSRASIALNRTVQKMLQQPHEKQEIDELRNDGKPNQST